MFSVRSLSFRFRDALRDALHDVDLEIAPGEFVVVAGPSGCGKSTLALALGGYLFRQYDGEASGSVQVTGMDVRQTPIYDVADVVGLVQQNPENQFCTLTVRDEVAFGLENRRLPRTEIGQRIDWALDVVGAGHLAARSLATLSGGEKQKVAVAAMLAAHPQALIFDEPTSNLDPAATAEIFDVIARIRAETGLTVIVIEHKLDYLRPFAPRLVRMAGGRVVYDGPMAADVADIDEASSEERADIGRPECPAQLSPTAMAIRVEGLHVGYDGRSVLRDVSLVVRPGELVAVMGDNGSGKTTLLRSLLGLIRPERGQVEVLGNDARRVPVSQLAQRVGMVFQNPDHQLFAPSVWQEATFAPRNFGTLDGKTERAIAALLARSGLAEREEDHPYRLSYGEKRRLNLISVLAYQPRLILLDEVLIGQDPDNAAFLLDLLRERVDQGGAVVMVNHNPAVTRRYADRVIFFEQGRVLVDAPNPAAFRRLSDAGRRAYLPRDRTPSDCDPARTG